MTPKPRRAAIYARVSTERQGRDQAVSIGEQVAQCRALIEQKHDRLTVTYIDDRRYRSEFSGRMVEPSAKRADRPEWARMLAAAGKEWDVLYAWRTDRICRGNETAGMFERILDERRIAVELVTQTFDRDTFGLLSGGVGGYELRNIAARMNMGREGRVRGGRHVGLPPFGYAVVRDERGVSINYTITPEGRAFFDELAALFLSGETYADLGRRLGARYNAGRAWSHSSMRARLASPFYRGQLVYGRRRPEGQVIYQEHAVHPAAWDAATIAALDAEIARRQQQAKRGPRRRKHTYLFTGVLVCGLCGRMLAHGGYTHADTLDRRYVCHSTRDKGRPNWHAPNSISETAAAAQFLNWLDGLNEADIRDHIKRLRHAQPVTLTFVSVQAQLDQLEAEREGYQRGIERVRGISEAEAALADKLRDVERHIAALQAETAAQQAAQIEIELGALETGMLHLLHIRADLREWITTDYDRAAREIQAQVRGLRVVGGKLAP